MAISECIGYMAIVTVLLGKEHSDGLQSMAIALQVHKLKLANQLLELAVALHTFILNLITRKLVHIIRYTISTYTQNMESIKLILMEIFNKQITESLPIAFLNCGKTLPYYNKSHFITFLMQLLSNV
jgi:hypothetical protein